MVMNAVKMNWLAGVLVLALAPVATVSAEMYTDNFDRDNSATLGGDWSNVSWGFTSGGLGIDSNMAFGGLNPVGSYYSAKQLVAVPHAITSVDFRASNSSSNGGIPNLWFGLNYNGSGADPYAGPVMMVQGTVGCKFAIDGDWRDVASGVTLTAGDWYKLTVEQNGANFTGTLSTAGGATVIQHTYTSLVQTAVNGYAYIGQSNFGLPVDNNSPAFDNFSLTIVPEPGTLALLATGLLGLLAYAWRKRK
jgi:hypothetical protein